jgi:hypothetical protein
LFFDGSKSFLVHRLLLNKFVWIGVLYFMK